MPRKIPTRDVELWMLDALRTTASVLVTDAEFTAILRRHRTKTVLLAIEGVRTIAGAMRLHAAERDGRARRIILRQCERRVAELRLEQRRKAATTLIAKGEAHDRPTPPPKERRHAQAT